MVIASNFDKYHSGRGALGDPKLDAGLAWNMDTTSSGGGADCEGHPRGRSKKKEANAALQKKAPFGTATKIFADTESKTQIRDLQNAVASAEKHCEKTFARLKQNEADRRTLSELFFRDCLNHCDKIASTKAFEREAGTILNRLSKETNALWVGQTKQHLSELDQLAALIATLRASYEDQPGGNTYEFH